MLRTRLGFHGTKGSALMSNHSPLFSFEIGTGDFRMLKHPAWNKRDIEGSDEHNHFRLLKIFKDVAVNVI